MQLRTFDVPVIIEVPSQRIALREDGTIGSPAPLHNDNQKILQQRDWWRLRDMLLEVESAQDAAKFLEKAGYRLQMSGRYDPNAWTEQAVTPSILRRLRIERDFVTEMLTTHDYLKRRHPTAERFFLVNTGDRVNLIADLSWHRTGKLAVHVSLIHALEAIVFTVHLDKSSAHTSGVPDARNLDREFDADRNNAPSGAAI